ncbi:MAG: IS66 family transposase [Patescibacteria group bacterium]
MTIDVENLPEAPSQLKEIIVAQAEKYEAKIEYLEERIRLLQNEIFGRKTEKHPVIDQKQLLLFNPPDSETIEESDSEIVIEKHTRKKRGRRPLPKDLPRIDVVHDIDDSDKICGCGARLSCIDEEVCEKLDYIPAKIRVIRHIRPKYACKSCEGVETEGPTVKIAPPPVQLIPKSNATPGLLAHIMISKFEDALPFYRQEKIFDRLGIDLNRATMSNWAIKISECVQPLLPFLENLLRSGPSIGIDETTVQVMKEPGRSNTGKSYIWVYRGGAPDKPVVLYQYHPTRRGQVPLDFLKGYHGYVQTDGYAGYDELGRQKGITLVGCMAHARRKFHKVIKAKSNPKKKGLADEAVGYIKQLYRIEKHATENGFTSEQRYEYRQQLAKPVLAEFKTWLDKKSEITPPKGLLGTAINYALNNWDRLERYIDHGDLRPDNNLVENAIRPFTVGRKNWLLCGAPHGAAASAVMYTLIETAKANGLKPSDYLLYLFEKLPFAKSDDDYRNLLPQSINPDLLKN